jgi:proton-translocating NADH-quinone oxidoreductase chain N
MFVTDIMELLFAGAMVSLLADLGSKFYGNRRVIVVGFVPIITILGALWILVTNWGTYRTVTTDFQAFPYPLSSLYVSDRLTLFVLFTAFVIFAVVSLYSWSRLSTNDNVGPFNALLLLLLCSVAGVVSSGDFIVLFLFWEALSISAYGLVSFRKGATISLEATLKYFVLAGIGSLLALYGIAVLYSSTGSILLSSTAAGVSGSGLALLGLVFILIGFGVEAAVVPLHTWLPDVYAAAPSPAVAAVSGVVTGTGVFVLVKILQPIILGMPAAFTVEAQHLQVVLVALAFLTMTLGNLTGLVQTNLKRMLGYSSIAQTGYMLAALSTLSVYGIVAVVFTIWNHGLLKSNFFMLAGGKDSTYDGTELENLKGLGRTDRKLGFAFASTSLAMVGSPPFGLFWAEILVVQSLLAVGSPMFFWLAVAVVLNIVVSIGYYYRIINSVVFGEASHQGDKASSWELTGPLVLMGLSLLSGLIPGVLLGMIT